MLQQLCACLSVCLPAIAVMHAPSCHIPRLLSFLDTCSRHVGSSSSSSQALERREHDVTRGQLAFFAFTMLEFNVSADRVRGLLDKYARFLRLGPADVASLMASVDGFVARKRGKSDAGEGAP